MRRTNPVPIPEPWVDTVALRIARALSSYWDERVPQRATVDDLVEPELFRTLARAAFAAPDCDTFWVEGACRILFRDTFFAALGYHWPGDEPGPNPNKYARRYGVLETEPLDPDHPNHARAMERLREEVRRYAAAIDAARALTENNDA